MDPTLRRLIEAGDADDEVAVMVRLAGPAISVPQDARVVSRFGDIATIRVPRRRVAALREEDDVVSVKAPRSYRPELVRVDGESATASAEDERRPDGLAPTGRGVLVGVIDWGLDLGHPAFLRPDGGTKLVALWNQAADHDPRAPNRFGYGRIHSRGEIDAALATGDPAPTLGYDHAGWDVGGGTHGTATASIAVGSPWPGGVAGVAPDADVAFVNLSGTAPLGHSVAIGEAIDFVRKCAGSRPWVVNMSLGRHGGPHDGCTLLEQLLDVAVSELPGGMVVNSAGNYYSSNVHTTVRLGPGEMVEVPIRLERRPADVHEIDVWYRGVDSMMIGVVDPDGRRVLSRPGSDVTLTDGTRLLARVQHRANDPNNGRNEAVVRIQPDAPAGTWHLVVVGVEVVDGRVHAWIERDGLSPRMQARFDRADAVSTTTTGTICNGFRNLAVGAYDHHDPGRGLADFSSSGDTVDGRRKPNVVAPGERVLVARSRPGDQSAEHVSLSTRMSGTSMAAPFVTGTVACLMELTGRVPAARLRAAILESAERFHGEGSERAGSGYLDIGAAVEAVSRPSNLPRTRRLLPNRPARVRAATRAGAPADTTEAVMTSIHEPPFTTMPAPGQQAGTATSELPQPDDVLSRLGMTARRLFDIYVLNRRDDERQRLADRIEVVAGPGDVAAADLRPGDLLVRGVMGEGLAHLSVLVTGELHDLRAVRREGLEPEGRFPGRYAWVIEGGSLPRPREDRFARRVTDRGGYLPTEQALLRLLPQALSSPAPAVPATHHTTPAPGGESLAEAVNRRSPEYTRWYQDALNRVDSAGLVVDGVAGQRTRAAVRRYQTRKGLVADGVVGANTERALMADGAPAPPGFEGPAVTPTLPTLPTITIPGIPPFFPPIPIPLPFPFPPVPATPPTTQIRERKNVNALTAAERSALINAIQELKRRGGYNQFVVDHVASMTNAHRQPAFLPWHRQFILIYESELRAIDPSVTLPYWDWLTDTGVDSSSGTAVPMWEQTMRDMFGGNGSGTARYITDGPFASWEVADSQGALRPGVRIQRDFGAATWATRLPIMVEWITAFGQAAYDAAPWNELATTTGFRNNLEGWGGPRNMLHNAVHGWVGGTMITATTSPNDPCFFLHHCFVDKLWFDWQRTHPTLTYIPTTQVARAGTAPAWGINDDVPVFRVQAGTPVTYKAADTLNLTNMKDHLGATIEVRYV